MSEVKPNYLPLMSSVLITSQQLRLLDILGQGAHDSYSIYTIHADTNNCMYNWTVGEFGVVYKSHLLRNSSGSDTQVVAVKTLKSKEWYSSCINENVILTACV